MAIAPDRVTVAVATRLEARAARAAVGKRARVVETGIALRRLDDQLGPVVVSCGLAGGLREDAPTGTVLIPSAVRRPDTTMLTCDAELTQKLLQAAHRLGLVPIESPLVTSARLVRGSERAVWAAQGYAGADMETGLLRAPRVACVRVVLDTPANELAAAWEFPRSAIFSPRAWLDLPFFVREAPRCAALAARVLALALR